MTRILTIACLLAVGAVAILFADTAAVIVRNGQLIGGSIVRGVVTTTTTTTIPPSVNLVSNGTFTSGTDGWTVGDCWSLVEEPPKYLLAQSVALHPELAQLVAVTNGCTYQLVWSVVVQSGEANCVPSVGGTAGTGQAVVGVYTQNIVSGASGWIQFVPSASGEDSIGIDDIQLYFVSAP